MKKAQDRFKSLNDAINHKDGLIVQHYQGKIAAEQRVIMVADVVSENELIKQANEQLIRQLADANTKLESLREPSRELAPLEIPTSSKPAELLDRLQGKLPNSKASLRDVEMILELLSGE